MDFDEEIDDVEMWEEAFKLSDHHQRFLQKNNSVVKNTTVEKEKKKNVHVHQDDVKDMGSTSEIPDIEECVPPHEKYRNNALYVTDFCSQMWCEQQMHYKLVSPEKDVPTEAMKKGIERHNTLELEVHDIEVIETETREDRWALKFFNCAIRILELVTTGLTRELQVFGFVDNIYLTGIIDEVKILKTDQGESYIQLMDNKGRASLSLPRPDQTKTTKLQLSLYKILFDGLIKEDFKLNSLFENKKLNLDLPLSSKLQTSINAAFPDAGTTLKQIGPYCIKMFSLLPSPQKLFVKYEYQEDHRILGTLELQYDREWTETWLCLALSYWKGQREPSGVEIEEAWKCRNCSYNEDCTWRLKKIEELSKK